MGESKAVDCEQLLQEIFGVSSFPDPPVLRGVRVKASAGGRYVACHPRAEGPHVVKIQQVPAGVGLAELLCRMQSVTVLRRNGVIHFEEIRPGAILR